MADADRPSAIPDGQARVLIEVENREVAGGSPVLLLRDGSGRHCLARQVGQRVEPTTGWVEPQAALDVALRVVGGEPRAIADPRALRGLAVALIGLECWLEEARARTAAAGEKEDHS